MLPEWPPSSPWVRADASQRRSNPHSLPTWHGDGIGGDVPSSTKREREEHTRDREGDPKWNSLARSLARERTDRRRVAREIRYSHFRPPFISHTCHTCPLACPYAFLYARGGVSLRRLRTPPDPRTTDETTFKSSTRITSRVTILLTRRDFPCPAGTLFLKRAQGSFSFAEETRGNSWILE